MGGKGQRVCAYIGGRVKQDIERGKGRRMRLSGLVMKDYENGWC